MHLRTQAQGEGRGREQKLGDHAYAKYTVGDVGESLASIDSGIPEATIAQESFEKIRNRLLRTGNTRWFSAVMSGPEGALHC